MSITKHERDNMKSVLSAILFFFIAAFTYGQYNSEFSNYENTGRSVSINADYDAGSNGIQNALMNKFIFGGYIDKKTKDAALSKMHGYNQLGLNLNYNLCVFFGRKANYDFLIAFKDQQIFNATYTKDFYELLLYGNKPFLDKTANFSGTNINALRFQEFKFGVIMHKVDSTAKIGLSVSFLKGEQLFYVKANKNSSLYTNADGTELIFNSNFNMAMSDTANKKDVWSFNGIGASADIFFETPYKGKIGRQSILTVNANNIGFIHWGPKSIQYSSDSIIKFDGYHINNIVDLKDSTLHRINADSALRKVTNARQEEFNTNIPTNLIIINKVYFTRYFSFNGGFRYIFHANYKPYIFMEPEIVIANRFTISLHFGYGGYTRMNAGIALMYKNRNWFVRLGSNSLQGYLAPKTTYGQGLFFSVAKKFK
jgi:hypothetical protein